MDPSGQRVIVPGSALQFDCYASIGHITAIEWQINGTRHDNLDLSINITTTFHNDASGSLVLLGISNNLNNTDIRCIVNFSTGNIRYSQGCIIKLQGMKLF